MKKRLILRIGLYSLGVAILLCVVLVAHILAVTKPSNNTHVNWQLSRIDFENSLNDEQAQQILKAIKSIDGIKNTFVNNEQGTLVYSYQAGQLSNEEVYNQFTQKVDLAAKPYVAPPIDEASGCPVMDKESLSYRFSSFVQKTFR
ncbi:MAG: hypothetical protein HWE21_00080 [Cytophagia bacterium]|nr:hypothetical protein [Cytophagia bacterium]NVK82682.1 hypothetical protein [Cytophagia bacterium]